MHLRSYAQVLISLIAWLPLSGCTGLSLPTGNPESEEALLEDAQRVSVEEEPGNAWISVKETLAHLSLRQPVYDDENLVAFATVDEGSIRVWVRPGTGVREAVVFVKARKYGLNDDDLAYSVLRRLHGELER